eukprot:GHVP01026803.1.p1 GENE.GHVP01026803.1~~GHVP01026803.1.p1  ORF type:complete len:261 (+),score=53.38 GHVP01026803.1:20-802(+)
MKDDGRLEKFMIQALDLVFITSGGTKVNLEKSGVRFLDNFSTGNRGSGLARCFLEKGYKVIFLCRRSSLEPFSFHMEDYADEKIEEEFEKALFFRRKFSENLLVKYFETVEEYFQSVKNILSRINNIEKKAILVFAAAVSDFFLPSEEQPEHKIQSRDRELQLSLKQTPKELKVFRKLQPGAYMVTFKLETLEAILKSKSEESSRLYEQDLVVANLKEERNRRVLIFSPKTCIWKEIVCLNQDINKSICNSILEHFYTQG